MRTDGYSSSNIFAVNDLLHSIEAIAIRFAGGITNPFNPMKTLHITLAAIAILSSAFTGTAQTITCDLFTVTGLEPDTFDVNSTLINIEMAGGVSDFANYPYIPAVTDCNGDTVATGGMFFFGQIGGTEQGYPVSLLAEDVCLPLTIEFVFGNDLFENDTCLFTYGTSGLSATFNAFNQLEVFPNPTQGILQIETSFVHPGTPYIVSDQMGSIVFQGTLNSTNARIDMSGFSPGIYMLRVGNEVVKVVKE